MKISEYLPIIGIVLFLFIIWNIGPLKIIDKFKEINVSFFILALILAAMNIATKGLKWKQLIKAYNIDYPLKRSISIWLIGFSAGLVTPGRLGDFLRSVYLKMIKRFHLVSL